MKLLVLGGTVFVGRHIVEAAVAAGHEVTIFHRGRHGKGLFPGVSEIFGDRDQDLDLLDGRRWDAVIDTSGYVPRQVESAVKRLADVVDRYIFISTISVYDHTATSGPEETSPLKPPAEPGTEGVTGETYGPLKVACEEVLERLMPERALVIRPGIIVGPHDSTDRFTYWVVRMAWGGEVIAPLPAEAPMQAIDARDLGEWVVRLAEARATGTFNAVGPGVPLTLGGFLEACNRVTEGQAQLTWVTPSFLQAHGVEPMSGLPFWLGEGFESMMRTSASKAHAAGLTHRALEVTIADTLAWYQAHPHPLAAGLKAEKEHELLAAWSKSR